MAKIGNVFNLNSFTRFNDSHKEFYAQTNLDRQVRSFSDSSNGLMLGRTLQEIDPTVYEKAYPELTFVNSGITFNNAGGWAEVITSLRMQPTGGFATASESASDSGKISFEGEQTSIKARTRSAECSWTLSEVKTNAMQGINTPEQHLSAFIKIYQRELDQIGYLGVDTQQGLLNWSGFTTTPAAGVITTLTAQQMYDEFKDLIEKQASDVANTPEYKANIVVMPIKVYNVIQKTILNSSAGAMSVLSALKMNHPEITFTSTFQTVSGLGSATVAYNNSASSMQFRLPIPLEIGEIIRPRSFRFDVDAYYRVAGLDILDDTSGHILTGL